MKKTALFSIAMAMSSYVYAAPKPNEVPIKLAAERAFNVSPEVMKWEDAISLELKTQMGNGSTTTQQIVEKDCSDAGDCVYIVSVVKSLLGQTGQSLATLIGKYSVKVEPEAITATEIAALGILAGRQEKPVYSEAKIKAVAMADFVDSPEVLDWENVVAEKIGELPSNDRKVTATIIETDCTNAGKCLHIVSVVEEFMGLRSAILGRVIGKYLVTTKGEVVSTKPISIIGNTL
ncbi:MAG: hypothetical protein AB7T49_01865 [Oligoflexales bacterium]